MIGKDILDELVKANATLSKSITALTETNSRLAKKIEHQAAEVKKRGGGGVKDSDGSEGNIAHTVSRQPGIRQITALNRKRTK